MKQEAAVLETVLCVPGLWPDRSSLVGDIARGSGGYLFAGQILMHTASKAAFTLQVEAPDPRLVRAYRAAGAHWVTAADLDALSSHTFVLYLIGEGGSRQRAEELMLAASGLLRAGGLSVKVESSGIAHSKQKWLDLTEHRNLFRAHEAFVVYITGEQIYTCGMHNLGYPDAVVSADASNDAVELLRTFTYYLFTENPTVLPGQTFSASAGAPVYRLSHEPCRLYEGGSLFTNPFGMWRLAPAELRAV